MITEFALLTFKSPLPNNLSDNPTLHTLLRKLSAWQSECSSFPLRFFTNSDGLSQTELYLVTGWASVTAHEAWIRGERNQELLRVFTPYVDIPKVRMVHLDLDFEAIPKDGYRDEGTGLREMIIERYLQHDDPASSALFDELKSEGLGGLIWSLVGRDLAQEHGDVYRIVGSTGSEEVKVAHPGVLYVERWVMKEVEL